MVGAIATENDLEGVHAPLQAKSMDHPRADEAEWVALLEGGDAGTGRGGARALHFRKLKNFGVPWRRRSERTASCSATSDDASLTFR